MRDGELQTLLVGYAVLDKTVSKEAQQTNEQSHHVSLDDCRNVAEILILRSYFMPRPLLYSYFTHVASNTSSQRIQV